MGSPRCAGATWNSASGTWLTRSRAAWAGRPRRWSRRFSAAPWSFRVVSPGNVARDTERVIAGNDRYEVVEKFGSAVGLADAADQRAPGRAGQRDDEAEE